VGDQGHSLAKKAKSSERRRQHEKDNAVADGDGAYKPAAGRRGGTGSDQGRYPKRRHYKGNQGPDQIDGKAGDDHIDGRRGRDTLAGSGGDDLLVDGPFREFSLDVLGVVPATTCSPSKTGRPRATSLVVALVMTA
jgi:hypothetical protein